MTQEIKPNRLVILSKGFGVRFEKEFFLQIEEAFLGGYRIAQTDLRADTSMRNFQGRQGRAVLYLEGTEPAKWTPNKVEDVKVEVEVKVAKVEVEVAKVEPAKVKVAPELTSVELYLQAQSKEAARVETLLAELSQLDKMQGLKDFAITHGIEVSKSITSKAGLKTVIEEALKA
jgi:hypothetical protein